MGRRQAQSRRGLCPCGSPHRGHYGTWFWWVLAGLVAGWLLWMTLRPNQSVAANLAPLTCAYARTATAQGISTHLLIDLVGNVVVFAPLGAALALALNGRPTGRRLLLATLIGAGLSLTIELVQIAIPTRVAQLGDWLLNVAGTIIGASIGTAWRGVATVK